MVKTKSIVYYRPALILITLSFTYATTLQIERECLQLHTPKSPPRGDLGGCFSLRIRKFAAIVKNLTNIDG
jgi:hypothetical protein